MEANTALRTIVRRDAAKATHCLARIAPESGPIASRDLLPTCLLGEELRRGGSAWQFVTSWSGRGLPPGLAWP